MVTIIAECGVNHNGDEQTAYKLIDAAIDAGADVAKFQLFKPEGPREQYKHLCLPLDAYPRLSAYCCARGIKFACTAFDAESLEWLIANTDMALIKISSGEFSNKKLIDIAEEQTDCGMLVIQSIPPNKGEFVRAGFCYLHVVPVYPTLPENADLRRVTDSWCDGLSDHSGDIFMPLAAVALGAQIIECHITLDKNQDGPDHKASLDPVQFKEMVRGIRAIEKGLS